MDFSEYEQGSSDPSLPELLIAENDTAQFFLSGIAIHDIVLMYCPNPSHLIEDSRYRMPTKLEALWLRTLPVPSEYWHSGQRILCMDESSASYYTFLFGNVGTVSKAGYQTKYTLLPIRTEPFAVHQQHIDISVHDEWNNP